MDLFTILFSTNIIISGIIGYAVVYPEEFWKFVFTHIIKFYDTYIKEYAMLYGLKIFTTYCSLKVKLAKYNNLIYYSHPNVTYILDITTYAYKALHAEYNDLVIEPFNNIWISRINLINVNENNKIMEQFYFNNDDLMYLYDKNEERAFIANFNLVNDLHYCDKINNINVEKFIFGKYKDIYVSRIPSNTKPENNNIINEITDYNQISSVSFLSIELVINEKTITIDIGKPYLYVNNQILSRSFVKRYLDYNNIVMKFDDNYVINIMDSDINMITLKPNQYILIKDTTYDIVNI